jgi:hypothetical protein
MNDKLPPQFIKDLIAAGYGTMQVDPPSREGGASNGTYVITVREMEEMGEAERIRLGVQSYYEFHLEHRPPPTSLPTEAEP